MFAVGGYDFSGGAYTELLDVTTWKWAAKASYHFETGIYEARTLHHNDNFFTFGGWNGSDHLSRIASFSPASNTWTDRGRLLTPRDSASVIWSQDAFLVVGGEMNGKQSSEKCRFNGEKIECEYQNPTQPTCKYSIPLLLF